MKMLYLLAENFINREVFNILWLGENFFCVFYNSEFFISKRKLLCFVEKDALNQERNIKKKTGITAWKTSVGTNV